MSKARRLEPEMFCEGMDVVISLDLGKHKELLAQTQADTASFEEAVRQESARKRHYYRQIGQGKFDDQALKKSVEDMRINSRHLSDKVKLSKEKAEHHTLIVDTLTSQLEDYNRRYASINR